MNSLSPEIFKVVVEYLPKPDLSNFRLVQRSLGHLGKDALFRNILLHPTVYNMNRLLNISRRPDLANCVRELMLPGIDHHMRIWEHFNQCIETRNITHGSSEAIEIFRNQMIESHRFQESSAFMELLLTVFTNLPRLEYLHMASPVTLPILRPDTMPLEIVVGLYPLKCLVEDNFDTNRSNWREKDQLAIFSVLIKAAYHAKLKISSFHLNSVLDASLFSDGWLLDRAAAVFSNCKHIGLTIYNIHNNEQMTPNILEHPLADIITPAKRLQTLYIFFFRSPKPEVPFSKILGNHCWPHLTRITLSCINMHFWEIWGFCSRQRGTLRMFAIYMCELYSGRWVDMARFWKHNLRLECIELQAGLVDFDSHEYSMEDRDMMVSYIMRHTETLPEVPRTEDEFWW